jgi:hypothetical protein
MERDRFDPAGQVDRLCEILADYLESSERGLSPDLTELIGRDSGLAEELKLFLELHERLERLTEPLRRALQTLRNSTRCQYSPFPGHSGPNRDARQSSPDRHCTSR